MLPRPASYSEVPVLSLPNPTTSSDDGHVGPGVEGQRVEVGQVAAARGGQDAAGVDAQGRARRRDVDLQGAGAVVGEPAVGVDRVLPDGSDVGVQEGLEVDVLSVKSSSEDQGIDVPAREVQSAGSRSLHPAPKTNREMAARVNRLRLIRFTLSPPNSLGDGQDGLGQDRIRFVRTPIKVSPTRPGLSRSPLHQSRVRTFSRSYHSDEIPVFLQKIVFGTPPQHCGTIPSVPDTPPLAAEHDKER